MPTRRIIAPCSDNIDWACTPDLVAVEFTDDDVALYLKSMKLLKELGAHRMSFLWKTTYFLYSDADDLADYLDPDKVIYRLTTTFTQPWWGKQEGDYVEFDEPHGEYVIECDYLDVYSDGMLRLRLTLKHTDNSIWASLGNITAIATDNDREQQSEKNAPNRHL